MNNFTLFEGVIWKNEWNQDIAYVSIEGLKIDVIINSVQDQNRAFDRDKVVVELNDPDTWTRQERSSGISNLAPVEARLIDTLYKDDEELKEESEESIFEKMKEN